MGGGAGWGCGWGRAGRGGRRCTVGVVQVSKHDCNPIFILTCSSDCNLTPTLTVTLNLILTLMGAAEMRNNRPAGVCQRAISHEQVYEILRNGKGQRSLIHFNKAPIPNHKRHQILKRDAKSRMANCRVVASGVAMS